MNVSLSASCDSWTRPSPDNERCCTIPVREEASASATQTCDQTVLLNAGVTAQQKRRRCNSASSAAQSRLLHSTKATSNTPGSCYSQVQCCHYRRHSESKLDGNNYNVKVEGDHAGVCRHPMCHWARGILEDSAVLLIC
jgi:hypothetical protein